MASSRKLERQAKGRLVYLIESMPAATAQHVKLTKMLGNEPTELCESMVSPLKRKRLWWTYPRKPQECAHTKNNKGRYVAQVTGPRLSLRSCLNEGWWPEELHQWRKESEFSYMGLATKLPKKSPGVCKWSADTTDKLAYELWGLDKYAQDSRFYSARNRVKGDKTGERRRLTVAEEERLMGLGGDYTYAILDEDKKVPTERVRFR